MEEKSYKFDFLKLLLMFSCDITDQCLQLADALKVSFV